MLSRKKPRRTPAKRISQDAPPTTAILFPSGLRMAVVGGASWLILLAGVLRGFFRLSIFDLLFLLAPWVMAPLGLNLVAAQADRLAQMNVLVVRYLLFPAAALATASFFLKDGRAAGALVCPWLIVASAVALDGLDRVIRPRLQA